MMSFFKKHKMELGLGVVVVLAVWAYFVYFGGSSAPLTASSEADSVSSDLLVTLNSLHTIKLDDKLFSNADFISLTDFGVSIPQQASGRRNPFAPVGQGNLSTTTQSQ